MNEQNVNVEQELTEQVINVESENTEQSIIIENELVKIAPNMQVKQVSPSDETQLVTADEGYIGLAGVTVDSVTEKLQDKQVTPTNSAQVVTADEGYLGLSSVTVNGFADDPNFKSENIKKHVTINGVTGTYSSVPDAVDSGVFWTNPDDDGYYQYCEFVNWACPELPNLFSGIGQKVKRLKLTDCDNVESVVSQIAYNNTFIEEIDLEDSEITTIKTMAFERCSNLKKAKLPKNLLYISGTLFRYDSNLKEYKLPGSLLSVNSLSSNASTTVRIDCTELTYTDGIPNTAMTGRPDFVTLVFVFADRATMEVYAQATNWSNYASNMTYEGAE